MIAVIILAVIIILLISVIITRTLLFTPKPDTKNDENKISFDKEDSIKNLCELVKCKTVSNRDHALEDEAEFEKLINMLPSLYPNVFKECSFERLQDRALLLYWKGKKHNAPAVLMAHYDVVPVDEEHWEKPPFEAIIEDGVIWGRGTLDTKVTVNAILSSAENLIKKGFTPENDIYFAFSGGEEINGDGAKNIVDLFEQRGIEPAFVLDEGGAVVENVFPGVKAPCAMVGIAEKGMLNLEYKVKSSGGHASAPKPDSPLIALSRACVKLEDKPFKFHLTPPVSKMFDTLGRHSTFIYRMIFSNLWLFSPVLNMICKKSGGELNALVRTTVAFTRSRGSSAENVIPPEAAMISNIRLNPCDTMESAKEYIRKTIDNDNIELNVINGMEPSRISTTDCEGWDKVSSAITYTWKGCIVSPYLMMQCSDCRHWGRISDRIFRFSAMDLTSEERATIHGNNERIRIDCANRATEFYIRLIEKC